MTPNPIPARPTREPSDEAILLEQLPVGGKFETRTHTFTALATDSGRAIKPENAAHAAA
jgi:hypothetical protein